METVACLLLFLACASARTEFAKMKPQLEETEHPENITNFESLKEFVRLVEEHKLNVSLILSSLKEYEDGGVEEVKALTVTLPVNQESITAATLSQKEIESLGKVATKEKLAMAGTKATDNKMKIYTNFKYGLPRTREHKIFSGIKNGKTGFVFDEKNYVALYTFIDEKNQTTKVYHGDVDVEVLEKSDAVKDAEASLIKKSLVEGLVTFGDDVTARGISAILSQQIPSKNWDVGVDTGEDNFIQDDYWLHLKVWDMNYIISCS